MCSECSLLKRLKSHPKTIVGKRKKERRKEKKKERKKERKKNNWKLLQWLTKTFKLFHWVSLYQSLCVYPSYYFIGASVLFNLNFLHLNLFLLSLNVYPFLIAHLLISYCRAFLSILFELLFQSIAYCRDSCFTVVTSFSNSFLLSIIFYLFYPIVLIKCFWSFNKFQ